MTTSALSAAVPAAIAATTARTSPSSQPASAPLTRVSLAYIEPRFKLYLRFGEPARTLQLDRWRRCAMFMPGAMLCRVRWQANDYGTIRWQLMVMQAATPLDATQRIPGVQPGACLLRMPKVMPMCASCWNASTASRRWVSLPSTCRPPTGARSPTGSPRIRRCPNTPPIGTPPGWPGGHCHDGPSHRRTHTQSLAASRSRLRARLVLAGFAAVGLAALAWAAFVQPLPRLIYNPSDSVPVGWYRVDPQRHGADSLPRSLSVDSIVLAPLPATASTLAAQRGYLPTRVPLLKRVAQSRHNTFASSPGRYASTTCRWRPRCRRPARPTVAILAALPSPRIRRTVPVERDQSGVVRQPLFRPVSASAAIGVAHPIWLEPRP